MIPPSSLSTTKLLQFASYCVATLLAKVTHEAGTRSVDIGDDDADDDGEHTRRHNVQVAHTGMKQQYVIPGPGQRASALTHKTSLEDQRAG